MNEANKTSTEKKNKNPFKICIWESTEESESCEDCSLKNIIHCKIRGSDTLLFVIGFLIFLIPALIGMVTGGFGWWLVGYFLYWFIFFEIWENRILCSHCPFYAEDGGKGHILHCYANYGLYKTWSYNPAPMTISHKIQFIIAVAILFGFPLPFLVISQQFLFLAISCIGITLWLIILKKKICLTCLNFSCPFNGVKKETVDEFLKRNPVMLEAWEKSGYKIDS